MPVRHVVVLALILILAAAAARSDLPPSRSVQWLARDGVVPIGDVVATDTGFVDRVGAFTMRSEERALVLAGTFPESTVYRFDLVTRDGSFDMGRLYREAGLTASGPVRTGPWGIFEGEWLVPTARVALDGRHVYTSWFDIPSLDDAAAGRLYASFAVEVAAGAHEVRIAFDDFRRHTRWRPKTPGEDAPQVTETPNPLRPSHVASVAIGVDERVANLSPIVLRPELVGRHPRLTGGPKRIDVPQQIEHVDPDRGELWEYSDDAESMASGNDMDAGTKGMYAALAYDAAVSGLSPEERASWDAAFVKRFDGLCDFFVFERNYHPTGYAQNHCSATVRALIAAGLAYDGPEAERWLRWGAMILRKRVELLSEDGGLEWMNEGRKYGLRFWETSRKMLLDATGVDVAVGPFFENEAVYAAYQAPTPGDTTPLDRHFAVCDQVYLRSGRTESDWRARVWAGSVFGQGVDKAYRYNWAHCRVNQGSFVLSRGSVPVIHEAGEARTYRKSARNNNTIVVNGTDQWGGGRVWHPRLDPSQLARTVHFQQGQAMTVARVDVTPAYPPEARAKSVTRTVVRIEDQFLLFDEVETDGPGRAEWRFHAAFLEAGDAAGFVAYGFEGRFDRASRPKRMVFEKVADSRLEIRFLAGGESVELGESDVVFRAEPYRKPTRHVAVTSSGVSRHTLLTAFGPRIAFRAAGPDRFEAQIGGRSVVVRIGAGFRIDVEGGESYRSPSASPSPRLSSGSPPPAGVSIDAIVPAYMGDGLELAVTPTPRRSELLPTMMRVGRARTTRTPAPFGERLVQLFGASDDVPTRVVLGADGPVAADLAARLALPPLPPEWGPEAYRLFVGDDPDFPGGALVLLDGRTPAADFWALQTLDQLTARRGDDVFVRRGVVLDAPTFARRGSKRPFPWEHRFKANYAWNHVGASAAFAGLHRDEGAFVRAVGEIGLGDDGWYDGLRRDARRAFDGGVREFVLKYDDAPRSMSDATAALYAGDYFRAQRALLARFYADVSAWDAGCRLYFMPQPYWTNAFDLKEYGNGLARAGGLPAGIGLSFCGPDVISERITVASVERARIALGLTGAKAQIYDNLPRGGRLDAYRGRDADLSNAVDCVFSERGTPVTRITMYDYLWNPAAYVPDRSLRLACRELAGRDPEVYRELYAFVTLWNAERDAGMHAPRAEAVSRLVRSNHELRARADRLTPLLDRSGLAREAGLADVLVRGDVGDNAALEEREAFGSAMFAQGYREAVVRRVRRGPEIDGTLDDVAWNEADAISGFAWFRRVEGVVVPEAEQTEVRLLHDGKYLYVGARLRHAEPPVLAPAAQRPPAGTKADLAWRRPNLGILLDPGRDGDGWFHMVTNLEGWMSETHHASGESPLGVGSWWDSGLEFRAEAGPAESVIEARVPLASFGPLPQPGERWGAQLTRTLNGDSSFSFMYEFCGFQWPPQFGVIVFE